MDSWIKFSDRHPKDGQFVMFLLIDGSPWLGHFYHLPEIDPEHVPTLISIENRNEIFLDGTLPATHWMELPPAPEGIEYDLTND